MPILHYSHTEVKVQTENESSPVQEPVKRKLLIGQRQRDPINQCND